MNTKDTRLLQLLPHRPPMLLLDRVVAVSDNASTSEVVITPSSSFYMAEKGVPAWIGVEYMGQTAALIAGYQLEKGTVEPHVGFLLGTRKFKANTAWFPDNTRLIIRCEELAVVGDSLATFACYIYNQDETEILAEAKLSVFRKPIEEPSEA